MRWAVIGAGAIGSLFAARLHLAGEEVAVVARDPSNRLALRHPGLVVEPPEDERRSDLRCEPIPLASFPDAASLRASRGPADRVLVAVKAHQTAEVAPLCADLLAPGGFALSLQNGMGNAEALARYVPPESLLLGTTAQGVTRLGPGRIRHAGRGETLVGPWVSAPAGLRGAAETAEALSAAQLPARPVDPVLPYLWMKLVINAAINPVSALTGRRNGELLDGAEGEGLLAELAAEAERIASRAGVPLPEPAWEAVRRVALHTAANRSSMLQDLEAGRATEVGQINGYLAEVAERLGEPAPLHRAMTMLVRMRERRGKGRGEGREEGRG